MHLYSRRNLLVNPFTPDNVANDGNPAENDNPSDDVETALIPTLVTPTTVTAYATTPILQEPNLKPRLAWGDVEFSITHVPGWCAVALSKDSPVGIDAEPIECFPAMDDVVSEFFPSTAGASFQAASPDERARLFFRWWTRIEASLKAAGRGLDHARSCFEGVRVESSSRVPGLAMAVAAKSSRPLRVAWHVPQTCDQQ